MEEKAKKVLGTITLEDGTKKEVLERKGKFYICKDTSFFTWRYKLEKPVPQKEKKTKTTETKDKKGTVSDE